MKITKQQLARIIKEYKKLATRKPLNEGDIRHPKTGENMLLMINGLVDLLLNQGMDEVELANELRGLADDTEDSARIPYG